MNRIKQIENPEVYADGGKYKPFYRHSVKAGGLLLVYDCYRQNNGGYRINVRRYPVQALFKRDGRTPVPLWKRISQFYVDKTGKASKYASSKNYQKAHEKGQNEEPWKPLWDILCAKWDEQILISEVAK